MKILEDKILRFDNWSQPWTFYEFVSKNKKLTKTELNLFNEIWVKAGDFELWNNGDILLNCKTSQAFIEKNYGLTNEAITNIVRALSYEWK